MPSPRQCFVVLLEQRGEAGYIPSLVTEDEPGHAPLIGKGQLSEPWYWGDTFEKAEEVCAKANADLGLSADDVAEIVESSIAASIRATGARDRYDRIVRKESP